MSSMIDTLIGNAMNPEAQAMTRANVRIVDVAVDKLEAEAFESKKDTAISIGQALQSDIAVNNVAVRETLEELLKQLAKRR